MTNLQFLTGVVPPAGGGPTTIVTRKISGHSELDITLSLNVWPVDGGRWAV